MTLYLYAYTPPQDFPMDQLILGEVDGALCLVEFNRPERLAEQVARIQKEHADKKVSHDTTPLLKETEQQLDEYFIGERQAFELPLAGCGTPFQKQVWQSLLKIPHGETWSYSAQASILQNPKAVRAVAGANSKNPISIIVPCHRVIGKSGSLIGYAGGLKIKKWLLEHEKKR